MAADIVNPYANPYLPSFVNQRPRMNEPLPTPNLTYSGITFSQIHPVKGFEGARAYANSLANGASEIVSESDPNVPMVYIVAKDANGQVFLQGLQVMPVEEPKPVTMDDLSTTMNQILERLNKLEGENNGHSGNESGNAVSWKSSQQPGNAANQSNVRNDAGNAKPGSSFKPNSTK